MSEDDGVVRMGDFYEDCRYHPMLCVWRDDDMLTGVSLVDGKIGCCSASHCGVQKLDKYDAVYLRLCGPLRGWPVGEKCPWPKEQQWWREDAAKHSRHGRSIPIKVPSGWKVYPGCTPEGGELWECSDQLHWSEDMFGATGDEWVIDIGSYGDSHVYTCLALRRRPVREAFPDHYEETIEWWGLEGPDALVVNWREPDVSVDFEYPEQAAAWAEAWMRRGGPPED
jgi:hypothetical protein